MLGGDEERGRQPVGVALSHGPSSDLTHLGTAAAGVPVSAFARARTASRSQSPLFRDRGGFPAGEGLGDWQ